jgi:hypothetical protein
VGPGKYFGKKLPGNGRLMADHPIQHSKSLLKTRVRGWVPRTKDLKQAVDWPVAKPAAWVNAG